MVARSMSLAALLDLYKKILRLPAGFGVVSVDEDPGVTVPYQEPPFNVCPILVTRLLGVCDADMMFTDVFIRFPGRAYDAIVLQDSLFYKEALAKWKGTEYEQRNCNCKMFHQTILQGVCDAEMMFTDVFIGFPGRAHDARVLQDSLFHEEALAKWEGIKHKQSYYNRKKFHSILQNLCDADMMFTDAPDSLGELAMHEYFRTASSTKKLWHIGKIQMKLCRRLPHGRCCLPIDDVVAAFNYARKKQRVVIEQAFDILKA
ncbi:hypothetical protein MRX96_036711 [Rhipicephalus microplus]